MKIAQLRPKARQDLRHELIHYRGEASQAVAQRLRLQAEQSIELLARNPGLGWPTLGRELGIENLRTWPLSGYPLLWLYIEHPRHLDVVRLLGQRQDIASILLDKH